MEDYKIIQVIPNTKELYVKYKDDQGDFTSPIVCFALVEYNDGERELIPMNIDSQGIISHPADNQIEVVDKPII